MMIIDDLRQLRWLIIDDDGDNDDDDDDIFS